MLPDFQGYWKATCWWNLGPRVFLAKWRACPLQLARLHKSTKVLRSTSRCIFVSNNSVGSYRTLTAWGVKTGSGSPARSSQLLEITTTFTALDTALCPLSQLCIRLGSNKKQWLRGQALETHLGLGFWGTWTQSFVNARQGMNAPSVLPSHTWENCFFESCVTQISLGLQSTCLSLLNSREHRHVARSLFYELKPWVAIF